MHYSCSYDEVEVEEAIDLVRLLPKRGSMWRAARGEVDAAWSEARHLAADIIDMMSLFASARAGIRAEEAGKVMRPSDVVAMEKKRNDAVAVSKKIRETEWKDA